MADEGLSIRNTEMQMNKNNVELIASYWTIAGDTYPGAPSEISPYSLQQRAEAASKAGWKGMGLVFEDIVSAVQKQGMSTVRKIFDDNGITHREVEFLVDWHLQGERRAFSDNIRDQLLDIAGELGATRIKGAGGLFEEGDPDVPVMREAFAVWCDKAAAYGVDVALEFLPFSSVNTIDKALAVTQGVRPNGGVLVDTWHVARGGMSYDEIAKIPVDLIKGVELNDADATLVGDFFNDSTHHRKLCGEGDLNTAAFIQAIVDRGYTGAYGVEIISKELRAMPLEVAAKRVFETTMAQFENIRFPEVAA